MQRRPIYLDYAATTPVDPRVRDAMIPWLTERFGNPASRTHAYGWEAEKAVEEARSRVAELVGCEPRELVWTSGATVANTPHHASVLSDSSAKPTRNRSC